MDYRELVENNLADFLTAPFGTRWWLFTHPDHDAALSRSSSSESPDPANGWSCLLVATSPGVANMDSTVWTEGLDQDEDGYWHAFDGEEIGLLIEDVIRYSCENGDVTDHVQALVTKIEEAVRS